MSTPNVLTLFVRCIKKVPDPRSRRGQSHIFHTLLALTFLGLIGNCRNPTELQRWSENQLDKLRSFLRFRCQSYRDKPSEWTAPHAVTFSRLFAKLSLADLQKAFAEFINALLQETTLVGACDGKAAKQMKDANGDPILMLNVFAQRVKVLLASWSVDGDKTNEPGCLKKHLEELFEMYPCLKLLTGDAIFAQRPLLEAIQEYERDYLFRVKENQPKVLKKIEEVFKDAPKQEPQDRQVDKKRGLLRYELCG